MFRYDYEHLLSENNSIRYLSSSTLTNLPHCKKSEVSTLSCFSKFLLLLCGSALRACINLRNPARWEGTEGTCSWDSKLKSYSCCGCVQAAERNVTDKFKMCFKTFLILSIVVNPKWEKYEKDVLQKVWLILMHIRLSGKWFHHNYPSEKGKFREFSRALFLLPLVELKKVNEQIDSFLFTQLKFFMHNYHREDSMLSFIS